MKQKRYRFWGIYYADDCEGRSYSLGKVVYGSREKAESIRNDKTGFSQTEEIKNPRELVQDLEEKREYHIRKLNKLDNMLSVLGLKYETF